MNKGGFKDAIPVIGTINKFNKNRLYIFGKLSRKIMSYQIANKKIVKFFKQY